MVGTNPVSHWDVDRMTERIKLRTGDQARDHDLIQNQVVRQELLFQAAMDEDKLIQEDWQRELRFELRRLVAKKYTQNYLKNLPSITEEELKVYFDTYKVRYHLPAAWRLGRIFLRRPANADSALIRMIRKKLQRIRQRLGQGDDFSTLAKQMSEGPEATSGGVLGWREEGQLPKTWKKAVVPLVSTGELSKVVEDTKGFHLFLLLEKRDSARGDFTKVRKRVEADYRIEREKEALEKLFSSLRTRYVIK